MPKVVIRFDRGYIPKVHWRPLSLRSPLNQLLPTMYIPCDVFNIGYEGDIKLRTTVRMHGKIHCQVLLQHLLLGRPKYKVTIRIQAKRVICGFTLSCIENIGKVFGDERFPCKYRRLDRKILGLKAGRTDNIRVASRAAMLGERYIMKNDGAFFESVPDRVKLGKRGYTVSW